MIEKKLLIFTFITILIAAISYSQTGENMENATKVFSVNQFGAVPDDMNDDGLAIRKAIESAISGGPGAIVTLG